MLLTADQGRDLLLPHAEAIQRWHRDAYKLRNEASATVAGQWIEQDEATKGRWVNNLIVGQARSDEDGLRTTVPLEGTDREAVRFTDGDSRTALGRFRRVEMFNPQTGRVEPVLTTPLSPTADRWINNKHHYDPRQFRLFQEFGAPDAEPPYLPTHVLIGHTVDSISRELEYIVVACFLHGDCHWWFHLPEGGLGTISSTRSPTAPVHPQPRYPDIGIRPKEDRS